MVCYKPDCLVLSHDHCTGPTLYSLDVARLDECRDQLEADALSYGIKCVQDLVDSQEVQVSHSTDIARLKQDAASSGQTGLFVVHNATILTMETGSAQSDIVYGGVMVVDNGVIREVGHSEDVSVPENATMFDAQGGKYLNCSDCDHIKLTPLQRIRYSRLYRLPCTLGWPPRFVSSKVLGNASVLGIWCNNYAQVSGSKVYSSRLDLMTH